MNIDKMSLPSFADEWIPWSYFLKWCELDITVAVSWHVSKMASNWRLGSFKTIKVDGIDVQILRYNIVTRKSSPIPLHSFLNYAAFMFGRFLMMQEVPFLRS